MARTYLIADDELGYGFGCESCRSEAVQLGWGIADAMHAADTHECSETQ